MLEKLGLNSRTELAVFISKCQI
nr:hypothetical protein [Clostridium estertheticum]